MIRAFHFVKSIFIALVTKAIALCMIFESALTQKCHIEFSAQRAMILDHTGLYSCDDKFRRNNVWQIYFSFLNCCNAKVQNVHRSMKSWRKLKVIFFHTCLKNNFQNANNLFFPPWLPGIIIVWQLFFSLTLKCKEFIMWFS